MNKEAFKQRMQNLKSYREQNPGKGYLDWKASLPDNLQDDSSYNLKRAYELGYEPEYIEEDRSYHLPTRDSETGEILKKPWHPTFLIGLQEDAKLGYYPQTVDGTTYTTTWEGNENPIYKYANGGEIGDEEKQYLKNWYSQRRQYANSKAKYMNKQLDVIRKGFVTPDFAKTNLQHHIPYKGLDQIPITIDDNKVKSIDNNAKGYYHPNEGIVLTRDYRDPNRENLLHEMTHRLNYKQSVIDRALREESTFNKIPNNVTEEIIDQRNRTYELMQEPYARNRAKEVDAQYGTDYLKVYDSMLDKYVNIDEYFKLPDPQYKKMERPTIAAQVTPAKGNTMYFNRDMIKAPEDIPSNVVLHEMGHLVDGAAGMNNEFLKKLGDKSKFIPFNQAKLMYPTMTKEGYNNILQGTEIKSYMNQFRNYLNQNGKLHNGNYTGSYKGLKKEIIEAPKESFNNIKAIFNLYRSPKLFNKDFQMIPIVNNKDNRDIS